MPPQTPENGRPNKDHRTMVNGILGVLRTGAPWRDLPERFGSWTRAYSRLRCWQQAGIGDRVLAERQSMGDRQGELDWEIHFVDGRIFYAHSRMPWGQKK